MGTTSALLFAVALVLDMGITVPPATGEVGTTELPLAALLLLEGGTPLLSFALMLEWGNIGIMETGTAVLSAVALPAELLPVVGNAVTWEGTGPRDPLPLVFWEVMLFRAGVITVVSVVVSVVVVSVVVVSVVVVSVVVVSVVVFEACVPKGQRGSGTGATASIWEEILHNEAPL